MPDSLNKYSIKSNNDHSSNAQNSHNSIENMNGTLHNENTMNGIENRSNSTKNSDTNIGNSNDFENVDNLTDIKLLPKPNSENIPLSLIIDRTVTYAYTELLNLIETLPSKDNEEKKRASLEYTFKIRQAFVKLIAIVKWSKEAEQINKAQRVVAFIQKINEKFLQSVDGIYGMSFLLSQSRIRNFDLVSAIDVFKTGTHNCFDENFIKKYKSPPLLTQSEKIEAVNTIEDEIRLRLIKNEILPAMMQNYKISNGRATFNVKNEFEISLTILRFEPDIPWHVLSLKIAADTDPNLHDDMRFSLSDLQIKRLEQICQNILITSQAQISEGQKDSNDNSILNTDVASPSNQDRNGLNISIKDKGQKNLPPLVQLYDFLHMYCLTIAMENFYYQSMILSQSRHSQHLRVDINRERTVVTLRYWISKAAASATPRLSLSNVDRLLSARSGKAYVQNQQISGVPGENYLKIRLVELQQARLVHSSAVDDSLVFPKKFLNSIASCSDHENLMSKFYDTEKLRNKLNPKTTLQFEWLGSSGVFTQIYELSGKLESSEPNTESKNNTSNYQESKNIFQFDITTVNAEFFLKNVQKHHSRLIISDLCSSVLQSGVLLSSDIEMIESDSHLSSNDMLDGTMTIDTTDEKNNIAETLSAPHNLGLSLRNNKEYTLRLWYRSGESAIDISVDITTGRLLVKPYSNREAESKSTTDLGIIGRVSNALNQSPWRLYELLLELRSQLTMSDIEQLSYKAQGVEPVMSSSGSSIFKLFSQTIIPLKISHSDNRSIVNMVLQSENKSQALGLLLRLDFVNIGLNGSRSEWYIFVVMDDKLRFYLIELAQILDSSNTSTTSSVESVIPLAADLLFQTILKKETNMLKNPKIIRDSLNSISPTFLGEALNVFPKKSTPSEDARLIKDAIMYGKSRMPLTYLECLVDTCSAFISTCLIQLQLSKSKMVYALEKQPDPDFTIPFSNQFPKFLTSIFQVSTRKYFLGSISNRESSSHEVPSAHLTSSPLSIYIPISSLMNASGVDWNRAAGGVPLSIRRNMVKLTVHPISLAQSTYFKNSGVMGKPKTSYYTNKIVSSSNSAAMSTVYGCSKYHVDALIPIALVGLPKVVVDVFLKYVTHDYNNNRVTESGVSHKKVMNESNGKYETQQIVIKRTYYCLDTAICDLVSDWTNISLMVYIISQIAHPLIKDFKLCDDKYFYVNRNKLESSGVSSRRTNVSCTHCGIQNIYSSALLLSLDIPNLFLTIYYSNNESYNDEGDFSASYQHLNSPCFEIAISSTNTGLDNNIRCNHNWNINPIACTSCTFNNKCDNCSRFSEKQTPFPWNKMRGSWRMLRLWLEDFKLSLNSGGWDRRFVEQICDLYRFSSILSGLELSSPKNNFVSLKNNDLSELFRSKISLLNGNDNNRNGSSSEYKKKANKYISFDDSMKMLFGGFLNLPLTIISKREMSVDLVIDYKHKVHIKLHSPGVFAVSGNFGEIDTVNPYTENKTLDGVSKSICLDTIPFASETIRATIKMFIENSALISAFSCDKLRLLLANKISVFPDIFLSNFWNDSLKSSDFGLAKGMDSILENEKVAEKVSEYSQTQDSLVKNPFRAIVVSGNVLLCNSEFLAVVLKILCEVVYKLSKAFRASREYLRGVGIKNGVSDNLNKLELCDSNEQEHQVGFRIAGRNVKYNLYPTCGDSYYILPMVAKTDEPGKDEILAASFSRIVPIKWKIDVTASDKGVHDVLENSTKENTDSTKIQFEGILPVVNRALELFSNFEESSVEPVLDLMSSIVDMPSSASDLISQLLNQSSVWPFQTFADENDDDSTMSNLRRFLNSYPASLTGEPQKGCNLHLMPFIFSVCGFKNMTTIQFSKKDNVIRFSLLIMKSAEENEADISVVVLPLKISFKSGFNVKFDEESIVPSYVEVITKVKYSVLGVKYEYTDNENVNAKDHSIFEVLERKGNFKMLESVDIEKTNKVFEEVCSKSKREVLNNLKESNRASTLGTGTVVNLGHNSMDGTLMDVDSVVGLENGYKPFSENTGSFDSKSGGGTSSEDFLWVRGNEGILIAHVVLELSNLKVDSFVKNM
ncbi:hypothetical protein BB559_006085 [Furculomyces boomerangus]|uniref:Mediator of RNA polymerase II transcription subunit 14 n=2 Tax=Furculomyces boomerangus TaxID=61424 RepID=A0A2T9Y4W2_9FUNG|nr:hypothetical protein BB559_006085 [Furculomyces boomerangus]